MAHLSKSDHGRVMAAIAAAEQRTAAEFAVAVVGSADHYAELRLLIPALFALLSSPLLLAIDSSTAVLAKPFPPAPDNPNEVPDRVVEL